MELPTDHIGPQAEFQCEHRQMLLRNLKDALECDLPPTAWACIWLADIERLESSIAAIHQDPTQLSMNRAFLVNTDLGIVVRQWSQRHRSKSTATSPRTTPSVQSQPSLPLTPQRQSMGSDQLEVQESELQPTTSTTMISTPTRGLKRKAEGVKSSPKTSKRMREDNQARSEIAKKECRERDRYTCILTKYPEPIDVAHIFPFSMGGKDMQKTSVWDILGTFWSQERVNSWYNAVFERGTEVVENLMCFAPHVHRWHTKGLFALQPVKLSEDRKCLTLKFYWLPRRLSSVEMDIAESPSIPEDLAELPQHLKAWNVITERKICSGDEIRLETPDPENLPLPDVRLLDMQWVLQRLMALSGAANIPDDHLTDDNDECGDPVAIDSSLN